jgi:hypothetical protein
MEGRRVLSRIFSVLLVVATILGLINVFADNADVRKLAEKTACGAENCSAQMTRESRSPIGQSFTFQASTKAPGSGHSVDVECKREYYLIGSYGCERQND